MPILDAALSFALTMLVVATVVTQILSGLRWLAKKRNEGLQEMLKEYFKDEFQPVVTRELNRLKTTIDTKAAEEISKLEMSLKETDLFSSVELSENIEVTTEELLERLKRSKFGAGLLTRLGDEAQAVFDELGRRYEILGDKFTESFRNNSRIWTSIIALILAVVLNIDSVNIASSYIKNTHLREGVIAEMNGIMANYKAEAATADSMEYESLSQAIDSTESKIESLKDAGFPIGWSYFPYAGIKDNTSEVYKANNNAGGWLLWVFGIILTGMLAGFGGPFWYDVVLGINRIVQRSSRAQKTNKETKKSS